MISDEDDVALGALGRELPWRAPDASRRLAIRAAILDAERRDAIARDMVTAGVTRPQRSRRAVMLGVGATLAAIAAVVAILLGRGDERRGTAPGAATADNAPSTPPVQRGMVQASAAADFVHITGVDDRGVNDEVVRLRSGRVAVAVAKLEASERFRIVAGDGEVEVRGTAFEVLVVEDRLETVIVQEGLVEVRVRGEIARVSAGAQWTREDGVTKVAALAPAPAPVPVPVPAPVRAAAAAPGARDPARPPGTAAAASGAGAGTATADATGLARGTVAATRTEVAFRAGRAALRDGDFGPAADAFERAIAADPEAPLAEDARYGRGVALARAGRDREARAALADFLARHPTSLHAGRASLVLGNLLVRAGEQTAARARFDAAGTDTDPEVRAAAEKAIEALSAKP